jgi:hypothetical protein
MGRREHVQSRVRPAEQFLVQDLNPRREAGIRNVHVYVQLLEIDELFNDEHASLRDSPPDLSTVLADLL